LLKEHRRQAFALKEAERQQQARYKQARLALENAFQVRMRQLKEAARLDIIGKRQQVCDRFRPLWEMRYHEEQAERRAFEQKELHTLGRIQNALRQIDFGSLIGRKSEVNGRVKTISGAFQVISDAGARYQAFERQQKAASQALVRQQRQEERAAARTCKAALQQALIKDRRQFRAEWSTLCLTQSMEKAKLKAQWLEKGRWMRQELDKALIRAPANYDRRESLTKEFSATASPAPGDREPVQDSSPPRTQPRTSPADLLPSHGARDAAQRIDEWQRLRADRLRREFGRASERGDERDR
jgi:hypothetical protein